MRSDEAEIGGTLATGGALLAGQRVPVGAATAVSGGSILLALLFWQFAAPLLIDPLAWPRLPDVIVTAGKASGTLLEDAWVSTYRALAGFALGCSLGVLTGLAMVINRWFAAVLTPYLAVLRPIPAIVLIPFFIVWFGAGDAGKIYMIALACFVVMVVTTIEGVRGVPPIYRMAATVLGASQSALYRTVILPAALPALMGGLRVCAAFSFGVVIAAEFMGAQSGLGFEIIKARRTLNTEMIVLSLVLIGALAFAFDRLVAWAGQRATQWMPR